MSDSARVLEILSQLDEVRGRLLLGMAEALTINLETTVDPQSDFLDSALSSAIGAQLLLHHASHEEKLKKKSFEYLLKYACEACGRSAVLGSNPTAPAADITIDGVGFSLKTQADSAIKAQSLYIQKLMEARWLRDYVTPQDITREAKRRICNHLDKYERIAVLRAFHRPGNQFLYELVEVPVKVLRLIEAIPDNCLPAKNSYGSTGVEVKDNQGVAFRLLLDGSVEKVRIFNLRKDRCIVHGTWTIPSGVYRNGNDDE